MAKRSVISLGGKKFFSIVVLSSLALGLMFTTLALQKPTSTQSQAAPNCTTPPKLTWFGVIDGADRVNYKLRVINTCKSWGDYTVKVVATPTRPTLYTDWGWRLSGETWLTPHTVYRVKKYEDVLLTVTRPGVWHGETPYIEAGNYYPVTVRAYHASDPSLYSDLNLNYLVEN